MEFFGYLTFVGDVQEIPTQNSQYGNEPFYVREICVHSFTTSVHDGQAVPFLRGTMMRMTGRNAQTFNLGLGAMVAIDYGSSVRVSSNQEGTLRANGNLNVNRIVEITQCDLDQVNHIMAGFVKK